MNKPALYTFSDLKEKTEYKKEKEVISNHNDQLKLLLGIIQFFNEDNVDLINYCNDRKDEEISILYIGSGKGYNIPILINMIKSEIHNNIKWYLYDSNGYCNTLENWSENNNIIIKNEDFKKKDINYFKDKKNILFINNIKSFEDNKKLDNKLIKKLINNFNLQNIILKELKPDFSFLKYILPISNYWKKEYNIKIPLGTKYIQAFTSQFSCELRLFLRKYIIFKKINEYDILDNEEKMYNYNINDRINYKNDYQIAYYIIKKMNFIFKKNLQLQYKNNEEIIEIFINLIDNEKKNKIKIYSNIFN